jgi:hypothetical protein
MTDSDRKNEEKTEKAKQRALSEVRRGHEGRLVVTFHMTRHGISRVEYALHGELT